MDISSSIIISNNKIFLQEWKIITYLLPKEKGRERLGSWCFFCCYFLQSLKLSEFWKDGCCMRNTLEFGTCQSNTNCDVPLGLIRTRQLFWPVVISSSSCTNYNHRGFASVLHPKLIFILNFTFSVILNLKKGMPVYSLFMPDLFT